MPKRLISMYLSIWSGSCIYRGCGAVPLASQFVHEAVGGDVAPNKRMFRVPYTSVASCTPRRASCSLDPGYCRDACPPWRASCPLDPGYCRDACWCGYQLAFGSPTQASCDRFGPKWSQWARVDYALFDIWAWSGGPKWACFPGSAQQPRRSIFVPTPGNSKVEYIRETIDHSLKKPIFFFFQISKYQKISIFLWQKRNLKPCNKP